MKDFLRKLLASLLCICMIGSGLPVSAIAEAMQDSATPPEQQSVSGGAEEQGGQSAQTQASEEQGGTTAQTQETAGEKSPIIVKSAPFNLIESGIMPTAAENEDFSVELTVSVGDKGRGTYSKEVTYDPVNNNSIYFKLTIVNKTGADLNLKLLNVMDWNGKTEIKDGRIKCYTKSGTNQKQYLLKSLSTTGKITEQGNIEKPTTLTVYANQTVVLSNLSNDQGGAAVKAEKDAFETDESYIRNKILVWKDTENEDNALSDEVFAKTAGYTSSPDTPTTGDVTVDLLYKKNEEAEANTTVNLDEGKDKLSLIAKITNTTKSELTLDLANALTVAGESITIDKDDLELTPDEDKSTTVIGGAKPSLADGKLTLPAGAMAYLKTDQFTVPYVAHETDSSTTTMQFNVTATVNGTDTSYSSSEPLMLNIEADAKEFKVIPSYSLDGVNFFEFTDDADLADEIAHVYDKEENSANLPPLKVKFRITIENISETKTLYFCLKEEQGTVTPPTFTGSPNETLEHGLTDEVLSIKPKESATLVFPKDKDEFYEMERKSNDFEDLKDEDKKTIFSFDVNEIKKNDSNIFGDVHGYHTQTRNVTLTYVEGVFGYSLSLGADADFEHITPEFGDDVDSSRLYNVNEKDGGTQELYLIGTTGTGAKKYVHASGHTIDYFADNAEDPINIVNDVPVAGKSHPGYQFVCWFDKNGTTKRVYMPGNPITKNTSSQHTIDAIWVGLQVNDDTVVYDGNSHNLGTIKLDLAGRPADGKYNFDTLVVPELGKAKVTYTVKKNGKEYARGTGDLELDNTITLNEPTPVDGVSTTATGTSFAGFTDVGVYQFEIKADYLGNGDVDPLPATCSATLTILPRPVVVEVGSGSVDWDSFDHTLRDVPDMTKDNVVSIVSAFDSDTLKKDVSVALTTAIEKIGVDAGKVSDMLKIYKSADGGFATGEDFAADHAPVVKYYPEGKTETDATEMVKDAGTYVAFISNIAALQAAKTTAAAAIAADKPDPVVSAEGNYVFIGLPGELNIKAPTLETIHITKNVVDAGFESGKFTFTVTEKGGTEPIKFVQIRDGYYVMKDMSKEAVGDGDPSISLTVEKNEEGKATASVSVNVPVGKTYVVRETAATEITPSTGRTADNYLADYDATFSGDAVTPIENEKAAEVTISAEAKDTDNVYVEVTVTNTANFYFVQNYVSDLDDEGEPVKYDNRGTINDKVLKDYPGYVADGALLRRTFAPDTTTTYADVHKNEMEGGPSSALVDQSIESGNQPDKNHLMPYNYKYDATGDGYVADARNNKYNANKNYLNDHLDATGLSEAVKPGETVNIFWDRDLNFDFDGDTRYVKVEKKNTKGDSSNQTSTNAIRQSEIKYSTEYIDWTKLSTTKPEDTKSGFDNISVYDSWQKVNAIDLKFSVDKTFGTVTPPTTPTPRYIFNTVVALQANGSNGTHEDITITDSSVYVDNIKGGSSATTLYLTPLVRVKYFIDDGTGKMIPKDGHNYTDINDFIYTVPVDALVGSIKDVSEAHNLNIVENETDVTDKNTQYSTTFTVKEDALPEDAASKYKFTNGETVNWLLKLHQMDHGVDITTKQDKDGQINIADCLFMDNNGHYFVDDDGYLVVALYLIEAHPAWTVTKEVSTTEATFGDTITYTITIENTGNVTLTNLYVRDDATATVIGSTDPKNISVFDDIEVSSNKGEQRKFTRDVKHGNYGILDQIDEGEKVTLVYTYEVGQDVKSVSNKIIVDNDDDLDEDQSDTTPPQTASTETEIRNWSVSKSVLVNDKTPDTTKIDGETYSFAGEGDTLTYAITVENTGNALLKELTLEDVFSIDGNPASQTALTYGTMTASGGSDSVAAFDPKTRKLTNLAVGETATITYTYKVPDQDPPKAVANIATVGDGTTKHNRTSEKVETKITSFTVTKRVLVNGKDQGARAVVKPGDELTYEVVVTNTGSVDIASLTVDDLMEEKGNPRPSLPKITFTQKEGTAGKLEDDTIKDLPAGKSITLQWLDSDFDGDKLPYEVSDTDGHILNTVTVTDKFAHEQKASAEALVKSWTVEKSVTGMSGTGSADLDGDANPEKFAVMGDTLTYTITVANTGDLPMTLFVEDKIGSGYLNLTQPAVKISHDPETTIVRCGDYTKITNLLAGGKVIFTYLVEVTEDTLTKLPSGILNEVKVHAAKDPTNPTDPDDRGESDPHDETETLIEAWSIDKELTAVNGVEPSKPTFGTDAEGKEDKNALVYPAVRVGDKLTYTVTVANTGSAAIAEIDVNDVLTSGKEARDFDGTPAIISVEPAANVTYDGENHLLKGLPAHTTVKLAYTYTVAENEGTLVNAVTANLPGGEEPQKKTVTTEVRDWTVAKEVYKGDYTPKAVPLADGAQVAVGDELTYVITVKNTGSVALTGLRLTDAFTFGDAAPVNGTSGLAKDEANSSENTEYAFANGVGSASIPVGGTLVLTGGYTVQQGDTKLKNAVTVADPDGETNAKTDDVTTRVRSWTVEKTVTKTVNGKTEEANTALPGRLLTYTIKITNTGDVTLNRLYLADVFRDAAKRDDVKALELIPDGPNYQAGAKAGEGVITNLQPGQTFTLKATYEVAKARDESTSDEHLVNTVTVDDDPTLDKAEDKDDPFPPQSDETETFIKNWNVKKSIAAVYDENGNERESKDGQYVLHVGDQIKYNVFVENTGDTPLTLYVEDSLFLGMAGKKWDEQAVKKATDVDVTFDSSDKGATWALFADNTDDQTHKGDCLIQLKGLPVGGTATVTYTYTVPAPAEGNEKLFTDGVTNEVVVHANDQTNPNVDKPDHHSEQDPKAETTTQIESWTLDKAITKVTRGEEDVTSKFVPYNDAGTTKYTASVQLGDVVTYTITIKNEGSTTIDQLNFVDIFNRTGLPNGGKPLTLDDMKSYGSSKGMNGAKISTDKDGIHITGLTPEETFTLTYETTVLSTDKDALSNDVTVTRKGDTTSKEKSVEVNVRETVSWSVEKTVEGMSSEEFINRLQCAKVGETLTYKITVTNTGSETLSGLKLEDVFNGNGLKEGQQLPIEQEEPDPEKQRYYDKETHIINNLGAGQSVTLAYDYTVVANDIELVNTATVSQPGGAGTPQTSEVSTPVETTPAWKVTKEVYKGKYTGKEGDVKLADGAAVSVGDELTYVITVENTGNTSLRVLSVKDLFGGEEIQKELVRFSQGVAYYNETRAEIQTLDAGRSIVLTYAHKVTEDDKAAGLFNEVTVTLPSEMETDKDKDHHAEVGNPVSAWTITKELTASDGMLGTRAVQIGDTMTYTITIANNGSAEIESLTVEDELIVTGWQYPQLDDMRLSADAPEGVTFTRSSVKDKNGKDTPANTGVLEHLGAGQTAMIECTYKVPGGVYYTSNAARAYPTGRKDEEQKTDPVIMPMYAVVTVHKIWTNADGKRLGANELKQLIGNTEVKFDILRANRTDSAFKPMTDANGVPYGVTLSANETPTWTRDFRSVVRLGNSPDEDDYRLYDVQERGVQTDKDGKTQYVMLNGHRFYYGKSYDFDGKTFNFTFTNELEGAVPTPTPTPGTTSSASATPTPTPSAHVPFTPTPGPAADAKYRVTKTAVNPPVRGYYVEGETVQYSIRVQNTGMVPIDALTITDHLSGVTFTSGAGYDLTGAREAFIDHLSAGMSVEIYASYVVTAADVKRGCVTNTVSGDGGTGPDGRPASGNAAEATVPTNDSTYDVTVHYLYLTDGTTAAPDDKINRLRPGDAYRFSCPTIDGYYASSLTVTGTMPAHDVEITVYYVPEDLLPSNGRGGPGLILLDEYGIPLGVGRVMLNVGDCFE